MRDCEIRMRQKGDDEKFKLFSTAHEAHEEFDAMDHNYLRSKGFSDYAPVNVKLLVDGRCLGEKTFEFRNCFKYA